MTEVRVYEIIQRYYKPFISKALRYGLCVTMGSHSFISATHTRTIPAFTPQPQGVTALWLVLTAPTNEGMARLS